MSRATPQLRLLAERLIAHEAKENKFSGTEITTICPVLEKLRPHLSILMGTFGFRSLLTRALALAGTEIPWLQRVQIKADGSLPRMDELPAPLAPEEIFEGVSVLLAQLVGLLVAFIGEKLTLKLLHERWPNLPPPRGGKR